MESWFDLLEEIDSPEEADEIEHLIKVPQVRQPDTYSCGIACVQSVLSYYGKEIAYDELCKGCKADPKTGTDHRYILSYLKSKGLKVELHKGMLLSDLQSFIDAGQPVIVDIQAWSEGDPDYSGWDNGHYLVAIGYDHKNIYFMDPSVLGHYTYIPIEEFNKRWHDKDGDIVLRQAGIVIEGDVAYDANVIVKTR